MSERVEVLLEVQLEIVRESTCRPVGSLERKMDSLLLSAGIGCLDEPCLEHRFQNADQTVVHDAIPEARLGDNAVLRRTEREVPVRVGPVRAVSQSLRQSQEIPFEVQVELRLASLPRLARRALRKATRSEENE